MSKLQRPFTDDEKRILCRLFIGAAFPYNLPQPVEPEDLDRLRDIVEGLKAMGYVKQTESDENGYPLFHLTPMGRALFELLDPNAYRLLEDLTEAPFRMQDIMRQHNLCLNDLDDPMQKLAFTLYTELVEHSQRAEWILGDDDGDI